MSADRADPPATPAVAGIPGKILAEQREAMGWTVEQVADQLKLAVRQVVALEAGDYAALPSPAVTRGFVRAYAKIVRLDPAPLVAQIDLGATGPNTGSAPRRERPAAFSEVRFPSHGKRSALPLGIIAAAAVAVLAIAGIAWKFDALPGMHRATVAATTAPAPTAAPAIAAAPLTTAAPTAGPSVELQNNAVPLISVPPPASTNNTVVSGVTPAGVATAPAATTPPATSGGNALVVNFKEDSWLQVRKTSGGEPLIKRLVKAGSVETFDVSEPVTVIVGKPSAVVATLRGEAVALPLMPGKNFSRVALK